MRYQVPQFIEIEDKVIGPFTIKQFVYVVGGAGLSFIIYTFLPLYIAFVLIAGVEALSLSLAFYKINNKPFIDFLESAFKFYTKPNLYIWKKEDKPIQQSESIGQRAQITVPKLSDSKLKDLSWSLGVKENINPVTEKDVTQN
ncbi:MAG: PrgI family protein [Minisyncoccia bacterium]